MSYKIDDVIIRIQKTEKGLEHKFLKKSDLDVNFTDVI